MSFYDLMGMSLGNLWRRKLRTFLTVLGVLIGTASIVAMLSLAFGMKKMIMDEYSSMGSMTQITVSSDSGYSEGNVDTSTLLTESNMELFSSMEYVTRVLPRLTFDLSLKQGKYEGYANLIGVTQEELEEQELAEGSIPSQGGGKLQLLAGNLILTNFGYIQGEEWIDYYSTGEMPDIDLMRQVKQGIVYDYSSYSEEGDIGSGQEVDDSADDSADTGEYIDPDLQSAGTDTTNNNEKIFRFDITGVLAGDENDYQRYSYCLLVEIEALKSYLIKNFGKENIPGQPKNQGKPMKEWVYNQFTVEVDDASHVEEVMKVIRDMGFSAESNKELLESAQQSLKIVELVLGGIGMVAFLVAAIGIANTMMMSTYERTKEIGIMKVLGCDMRDIQKLFLMEAGIIGMIGGVVGLGFTCLISAGINTAVQTMETELSGNISIIPPWLGIIAIAFSTVMGMVAGFFPARRAMKLSPLAAIRNE